MNGDFIPRILKFGTKLDLILRSRDENPGSFGAKCGIPERTMYRICAGGNDPSAKHLFLILTKGKISLSAFSSDDFQEEGLPE